LALCFSSSSIICNITIPVFEHLLNSCHHPKHLGTVPLAKQGILHV
jgi:hypothetical protein